MANEQHPGLDSHRALWTDVKCADLIKGQTVVTVDSELPVEAAAEVFSFHRKDLPTRVDSCEKWHFICSCSEQG